jgi:hypothetical protein
MRKQCAVIGSALMTNDGAKRALMNADLAGIPFASSL